MYKLTITISQFQVERWQHSGRLLSENMWGEDEPYNIYNTNMETFSSLLKFNVRGFQDINIYIVHNKQELILLQFWQNYDPDNAMFIIYELSMVTWWA